MTNMKDNKKIQKSSSQKRGKAKRLGVLVLLIAVVATVVLVAATRKTETISSAGGTFTVRQDNLTVTVAEAGSIRAFKSVEYNCDVERRGMQSSSSITILSIVPPGTIVTQEDVDNGFVLCQLDSATLEDRLVTERMSLASDLESVTSAKESYEIQILDNESSISSAELRVRFSLLDIQKYLGDDLANRMVEGIDVNGVENLTAYLAPFIQEVKDDPNVIAGSSAGQQLKRLQDDIVTSEGNLKTQQQTLAGTEKLYDANFVSVLDLDRDRLSLQSREFSLENSYISLSLFLDYDFPRSTEQYLSNYIEDLRSLQRVYSQCNSRLLQAKSRLSTAEERYAEQVDQVELLERQIANCTIRAKSTGMVVYGTGGTSDTFRAMRGRGGGGGGGSSGTIAEGETVSPGQTIISIPDTSQWIAEISVHETNVDKVRPGQPTVIVMDAFPDTTLTGEVISVAALPDQNRGYMNPDVKVYATEVRVNGVHQYLRSRMSCRVEILVERLQNTLIVPITVVANRGGRKVCYVVTSSGAQQERVVQTGVFNDMYVQILDGLQEGERVLLNPPLITESSGVVDVFEGVEALPAASQSQPTGGRGGTDVGERGQRGGERGERGGRGGMRGEGSEDMDPEMMQRMMEQFGGRGGGQGGGQFGGGGGRGGGGRGGTQ